MTDCAIIGYVIGSPYMLIIAKLIFGDFSYIFYYKPKIQMTTSLNNQFIQLFVFSLPLLDNEICMEQEKYFLSSVEWKYFQTQY